MSGASMNGCARRGSKHGLDREEWRQRSREFCRRGNDLPHARLNPDLVREIRTSKETSPALAARLGVHIRTIDKVRQYLTWTHVD